MRAKKANFYFFSGTGNTFLVIKKIKEVFEKNNIEVNLHRIEETNPRKIKLEGIIGLAFPVAVQSTYPFIWKFISNLPETEGTSIFIVDTLEKFSGGLFNPLKKILNKKGYHIIGGREIEMPSNLSAKIDKKKNKKIIEEGLRRAEDFAESLIKEKSGWKNDNPLLSKILYFISRNELVWKIMRKLFRLEVDIDKCNSCRLCEQLCPVKNIKVDTYPRFGNNCQICLRCISFCPQQAIFAVRFKNFKRYEAVNSTQLLTLH